MGEIEWRGGVGGGVEREWVKWSGEGSGWGVERGVGEMEWRGGVGEGVEGVGEMEWRGGVDEVEWRGGVGEGGGEGSG